MSDRQMSAVTCLGCGCACDDITITVRDSRIVDARSACALGVAWFGSGEASARVTVGGREATLEEAVGAAAQLLAKASRPLVYLAPELSCEAQRQAVALADLTRATCDSITST